MNIKKGLAMCKCTCLSIIEELSEAKDGTVLEDLKYRANRLLIELKPNSKHSYCYKCFKNYCTWETDGIPVDLIEMSSKSSAQEAALNYQHKPKMYLHWYIDSNNTAKVFKSNPKDSPEFLKEKHEHIKTEPWNEG